MTLFVGAKIPRFMRKSSKPHQLILGMRNASHRPERVSINDVLSALGDRELISDLHGYASRITWVAGRWVSLGGVLGETPCHTFQIGLPFARYFIATDVRQNKKQRISMYQFNDCRIANSGLVMLGVKKALFEDLKFEPAEMPFQFSALQRAIAKKAAEFSNHTGLSQQFIGHDLPTNHVDFGRMIKIEIKALGPVLEYIHSHWYETDGPSPSRETVAATLAALGMRWRQRGEDSMENQISPYFNWQKKKISPIRF